MKVSITVMADLGMQEVYEHEASDFEHSIKEAIHDLQVLDKHVDKDKRESWKRLELVIER